MQVSRLSKQGMSLSAAFCWGIFVFSAAVGNRLDGAHRVALDFLTTIDMIYFGWEWDGSVLDIFIITIYSLVYGFGGGFAFAAVYNICRRRHIKDSAHYSDEISKSDSSVL